MMVMMMMMTTNIYILGHGILTLADNGGITHNSRKSNPLPLFAYALAVHVLARVVVEFR